MSDEKDINMTPEGATPETGEGDGANPESPEASSEAEAENQSQHGDMINPLADEGDSDSEDAMLKALDDLPQEDSNADDIGVDSSSVSKAEFQQLSQPSGKPKGANIELLMDVNLPVSIELGRTQMSISEILSLGPGSVVELARLAGEPVDVMVNHKLVARGEVVVVDENFGVRVTQLITPEERIKILGEQ